MNNGQTAVNTVHKQENQPGDVTGPYNQHPDITAPYLPNDFQAKTESLSTKMNQSRGQDLSLIHGLQQSTGFFLYSEHILLDKV